MISIARIGPGESDEDATKRISIDQTKYADIDALVRGATIDPRAFEPCGYSMNAIHTNFVLDDGLQLIQKPYNRNELLQKVRQVLDN